MQEEISDTELSGKTKKRNAFKYHVLIYFIMNILFWTMWYITLKNTPASVTVIQTVPWPLWIAVGWGVIVLIHYFSAFKPKKE